MRWNPLIAGIELLFEPAHNKKFSDEKTLTIFPLSAHAHNMSIIALTELLGAPVLDSSGTHGGRVREVALTPAEDSALVSTLIIHTKQGRPAAAIFGCVVDQWRHSHCFCGLQMGFGRWRRAFSSRTRPAGSADYRRAWPQSSSRK